MPLDVEDLLTPIGGASPAGANLRLVDTTFDDLIELARELSPEEDVNRRTGKAADWPAVLRAASDALRTRSKDLQLGAWVALAGLQLEGVPGLCRGLDLLDGLIERFWDTLHPGFDEGELDPEFRAKPIWWLDAMLAGSATRPGALALAPFIERRGERPLTWNDRLLASTIDKYEKEAPDRYQALLLEGRVSTATWTGAVTAADPVRLRERLGELRELEAGIERLRKLCFERFGERDAPSLLTTSTLLADMLAYLDGQLNAGAAGEASEGATGAEASAGAATGPIGSRAAAVAKLTEVAAWFRRAEPHSPVSFLIERAVRWANMPFEELVRDYIKDQNAQGQIWETLGIPRDGS